jgi:1,2-diacylglycerol 3-alpha-glucosyltransferase
VRVGIVTEWFERGSAYVSKVFADQLELQGAEVFIYARAEHYRKGQAPWGGSNVHFGKYAGYPVAKSIHRGDFLAWLRKSNLDIVIFNEQQWIDPIFWAKSEGVSTVAYVDYYTRRTLKEFKFYDGVVCNTMRHMSAMNWHPNALFVPWGLDLSTFAPPSQSPDDRTDFFHSFGWDPYRKGTDLLIRAFAQIAEDYSLTVHGQRDLLEVFPELTATVESLQKRGKLRIVTQTVSAPGLYRLGRIYVYPSRLEGIGLSVPEALATGLPLVTTDEPPMSEFASAPHSQRVRVATQKTRSDGYFWPESEVDIGHLSESMAMSANEFNGHGKEIESAVRRWSTQRLDAVKNFAPLSDFLERTLELEPTPLSFMRRSLLHLRLLSLAPIGWIWRIVVRARFLMKGST